MADNQKSGIPALFMAAVDQAPMPVIITTLEGHIIYVNQAFCRNTGYLADEVIGQNPKILQSGLTPKKVYSDMWSRILKGQVWQGVLCNKNKKGELFWESISIAPVRDDEGTVRYFVGIWENVTDKKFEGNLQKRRLETLKKESITDGLTGLYNHRHILSELEKEIERGVRYKRILSGMMIDIDDFKSVNDRFGHVWGDQVLEGVAAEINRSIRKVDILGRYGGDEFLLILPESTFENSKIVAARIVKRISSLDFKCKDETFRLSVSIGLMSFDNLEHADSHYVIDKIDQALLKAKRAGKNQIVTE